MIDKSKMSQINYRQVKHCADIFNKTLQTLKDVHDTLQDFTVPKNKTRKTLKHVHYKLKRFIPPFNKTS